MWKLCDRSTSDHVVQCAHALPIKTHSNHKAVLAALACETRADIVACGSSAALAAGVAAVCDADKCPGPCPVTNLPESVNGVADAVMQPCAARRSDLPQLPYGRGCPCRSMPLVGAELAVSCMQPTAAHVDGQHNNVAHAGTALSLFDLCYHHKSDLLRMGQCCNWRC